MGRWIPAGQHRDWPLHLAKTTLEGPDTQLSSGLPATLAELAQLSGAAPISASLAAAQAAIDTAFAAFPNRTAIASATAEALTAVCDAIAACPADLTDQIAHRLADKQAQLAHVLRLALGIEARARLDQPFIRPGETTGAQMELDPGEAETAAAALLLPDGMAISDGRLEVSDDAAVSDPYRWSYDPSALPIPAVQLDFQFAGQAVTCRLPIDAEPVVLPAHQATVNPAGALINLDSDNRSIDLALSDLRPEGADISLDLPQGWQVTRTEKGITLQLPVDVLEGRYRLPVRVDGAPAFSVHRMNYPHIQPTARARPAEVAVTVLRAALPKVRVGYIGAGRDQVGFWLAALGADVEALSDADIGNPASLNRFDTIVIGIFALRFRPGLVEAMPALHHWCAAGGTLLTLYHRPWDNWDPETAAPKRLEIGQPSLRWRVTNEAAPVRYLTDHELLRSPNLITEADWQGWVKERGLYFAKSWDAAYTPLLEMADPGEPPQKGALLVADIGKGRHIHTALILHHQMANLVPGAFRLMANLLSPRADTE